MIVYAHLRSGLAPVTVRLIVRHSQITKRSPAANSPQYSASNRPLTLHFRHLQTLVRQAVRALVHGFRHIQLPRIRLPGLGVRILPMSCANAPVFYTSHRNAGQDALRLL